MKIVVLTTEDRDTQVEFAPAGVQVIEIDMDEDGAQDELKDALAQAKLAEGDELIQAEDTLRNAVPACGEFPAFDLTLFPYTPERRAASAIDRMGLLVAVGFVLTETTESYVFGLLGVDLAYLYQAIGNSESIDLNPETLLARILAKNFEASSAIWGYVNLSTEA